MRLYSLTNAGSVSSGGASYAPSEDGGFDFPDELSEHLHSCHVGGKPAWETYAERHARLVAEELERRQDPATLLSAFEQLAHAGIPGVVPPDA